MVDDHEEMIHELKVLYVWHVVLVIDDIVKRLSFFFQKKEEGKVVGFTHRIHVQYSICVCMCVYMLRLPTFDNCRW